MMPVRPKIQRSRRASSSHKDYLCAPNAPRGLKPAAQRRSAFSLMEVMIGIVILGLGMILVATMFPVAWGRARTLSEFTVERTITASGETIVHMLTRVSGPTKSGTSFQGDVVCDDAFDPPPARFSCNAFPTDTWVHALNLENILAVPPGSGSPLQAEDLWRLAWNQPEDPPPGSFGDTRVTFHERVYPPMEPYPALTADQPRWHDALDTRRFCWSVFHRLRNDLDVDPGDCVPDAGPRSFDMYYVTLRRSQPTLRFARQDARFTPDPCLLDGTVVKPRALPPIEDVLFPVAWRVQVEFPNTLALSVNASGLPTEITVPAKGTTFNANETAMMIQMFPRGAQFIDEITGAVYRVLKRRVTAAANQAVLTLDREVVFEDVDLPISGPTDPLVGLCPSCGLAGVALDPPELIRTVWVFPPPVQVRSTGTDPVVFVGMQPVVGIDVRPMTIAP